MDKDEEKESEKSRRDDQEPSPSESESKDLAPSADRRKFLSSLGSMFFLAAAVAKVGLTPRAHATGAANPHAGTGGTQSDVEGLDEECELHVQDSPLCGLNAGRGTTYEDHACTQKAKTATGNFTDDDCGKQVAGGTGLWGYTDHDCAKTKSDSDCGIVSNIGYANSDSACTASGTDEACGKSVGVTSKWADSDCSTSKSDQTPCSWFDTSCIFTDSDSNPLPPKPPPPRPK